MHQHKLHTLKPVTLNYCVKLAKPPPPKCSLSLHLEGRCQELEWHSISHAILCDIEVNGLSMVNLTPGGGKLQNFYGI